MNIDPLQQLRSLLEGKTILQIEDPHASEAICKFVLSDGTAFRLHATDMGFWVEETAGIEGYRSLHALITDYGRHAMTLMSQFEWDLPKAEMIVDDKEDAIFFMSPDGREWKLKRSHLLEVENNILNHKEARAVLLESFAMGDFWRSRFQPEVAPDLPSSCHIILR